MKINFKNETKKDSMLSRIVIHSMAVSAQRDNFLNIYKDWDGLLDLELTVNGTSLDIEPFVSYWQAQVSDMILKEAKNLVKEKLYALEDRLQEINQDLDNLVENKLSKLLD